MKRKTVLVWLKRILLILFMGAEAAAVGGLLWHYIRQESAGQKTGVDGKKTGETGNPTGERKTSDDRNRAGQQKASDDRSRAEQQKADRMGNFADGEAQREIRVRILGDDYKGEWHEQVTVSSETDFTVEVWQDEKRKKKECHAAGTSVVLAAEAMEVGEEYLIRPEKGGDVILPELKRAQEEPHYAGRFYLYREEEGIALVNELPLETYLCSVVTSEMPSDYPAEALKAQAVCARTYARNCMRREKSSVCFTDLDDSVAFQVYNNYKASETASAAVKVTEGEYLCREDVLYYSTSCGSEGRKDLGSEKALRTFLETEPEKEMEYGSPWVRWKVLLPETEVLKNLQENGRYPLDKLEKIEVTRRSPNGQAQELQIIGSKETITISGEYEIRKMLAPENSEVFLRDGQTADGMSLLPSAWFCVLPESECSPGQASLEEGRTFVLLGGGYGHGQGMSQCGAAAMAQDGADYREILKYYYEESELCSDAGT